MNADVKFILQKLQDAGYVAYLVGGCVRDKILGRTIHDYDICTSALPDEVIDVFGDHRIIETGLKHGTVTIVLSDGQYEVTTFRADGDYTDGRHPDSVTFVRDLKTDLSRRDFTINALADDGGHVIDYFGGIDDIQKCIIRCVGDADERFQEDALRILRALRFSSQLGFAIHQDTADAIHRNKDLISKVSAERIASELQKLIVGDNVYSVLHDFRDVLAVFIPEFVDCFDFDQKNDWHVYDVYDHICHTVHNAQKDTILRLAALLHDIGKPRTFHIDDDGVGHFYDHPKVSKDIAISILKRLRFDNATVDAVALLVYCHDRRIVNTKKSVRKLVSQIGHDSAVALLKLKTADSLAQNPERIQAEGCLDEIVETFSILQDIQDGCDCVSIKRLAIKGDDLKALGIPPSPLYSTIFSELLEKVIDDDLLNDKETLIGYVQTHYIFKIVAQIDVDGVTVSTISHYGKDVDEIEGRIDNDIKRYCISSRIPIGTCLKVTKYVYNLDFVQETYDITYRHVDNASILEVVE